MSKFLRFVLKGCQDSIVKKVSQNTQILYIRPLVFEICDNNTNNFLILILLIIFNILLYNNIRYTKIYIHKYRF